MLRFGSGFLLIVCLVLCVPGLAHAQQQDTGRSAFGTNAQIWSTFGVTTGVGLGLGIGTLVLADDKYEVALGLAGTAVVLPLVAAGMTWVTDSHLEGGDFGPLVGGAYLGALVSSGLAVLLWAYTIDHDQSPRWGASALLFSIFAVPIGATLGSLLAAGIVRDEGEKDERSMEGRAPLTVQFSF